MSDTLELQCVINSQILVYHSKFIFNVTEAVGNLIENLTLYNISATYHRYGSFTPSESENDFACMGYEAILAKAKATSL